MNSEEVRLLLQEMHVQTKLIQRQNQLLEAICKATVLQETMTTFDRDYGCDTTLRADKWNPETLEWEFEF